MPYVQVPKDLTKVKTKVIGSFTKRQAICFGIGAVIGVPTFFLGRGMVGNEASVLLMMLVMAPAFLLAMYERDGIPAEKIIRNVVRSRWFYPTTRPYKGKNLYTQLKEGD